MKPILIPEDFDLLRLYEDKGDALWTVDDLALYVSAGTPELPTNNGLGVLADAISCIATHQLNGQDEIVMQYPITGWLFDQIQLRAIIMARVDRTRGNQPYRIYRITKPINGIITIYGRHLAYDLAGIVVRPYSSLTITDALAGLSEYAVTENPFTFSTTRTTTANFKVTIPTPVWSLMGGQTGSLLDVYGGEYTFNGYSITLENRVGADNGVSVRYGVNMTNLEQDASCADCYTGVIAYWQRDDAVVYSDLADASGTYGYTKVKVVDMSDKWEEQPTKAQLTEAAEKYIKNNNIGVPKVSWMVAFVPLDMTEEYKDIAALEAVALGDTVKVKFVKLGVDASARVSEIKWNVLLDRYISVSLGSVKSNIANTIASQGREIDTLPTEDDVKKVAYAVASGIVADWIKTGEISADRIKGGTLTLGGDLDSAGVIDLYDELNHFFGKIYSSGIWLGSGGYSTMTNKNGFGIRKTVESVVNGLALLTRRYIDNSDMGGLYLSELKNGTLTTNIEMLGDGTINCKKLFVNGHEIT